MRYLLLVEVLPDAQRRRGRRRRLAPFLLDARTVAAPQVLQVVLVLPVLEVVYVRIVEYRVGVPVRVGQGRRQPLVVQPVLQIVQVQAALAVQVAVDQRAIAVAVRRHVQVRHAIVVQHVPRVQVLGEAPLQVQPLQTQRVVQVHAVLFADHVALVDQTLQVALLLDAVLEQTVGAVQAQVELQAVVQVLRGQPLVLV